MPQDRESGDRARKWGYENARNVAAHLGATFINPGRSNEATWNNRRILIKSAHYGDSQIGATSATLNRVDAIVAALQDRDGLYTIYEVSSNWFKQEMSQSRSPKASHVMMVRCVKIRETDNVLGRIREV